MSKMDRATQVGGPGRRHIGGVQQASALLPVTHLLTPASPHPTPAPTPPSMHTCSRPAQRSFLERLMRQGEPDNSALLRRVAARLEL